MNSQYRQPQVFQDHSEPASSLALTPVRRRIAELRRERVLIEKAITLLTEVAWRRDFRRQAVKKLTLIDPRLLRARRLAPPLEQRNARGNGNIER
jgi:hypothetical protein